MRLAPVTGGVRLAYPAAQLHKLRAKDVAGLLAGLDRRPAGAVRRHGGSSTVAEATRRPRARRNWRPSYSS